MLLRFIFITEILISVIQCRKDVDFCTPFTSNIGPIPPVVSESFIMMGEYLDGQKTVEYEEYLFDALDIRAKYMRAVNGTEFHYIFDYETERIITYELRNPGWHVERDVASHDTCSSFPMADHPYKNIFGMQNNDISHKRPEMFTSDKVLKFGGEFVYASMFRNESEVTSEDRSLILNQFIGCYYDKYTDSTEETIYSWTSELVYPASMKPEAFDDIFVQRSVPVQRITKSSVHEKDDNFTYNEFHQNIVFFMRDPYFVEESFQVPPYIQCKNYEKHTTQGIPRIAEFFSTRMEELKTTQTLNGSITSIENTYTEFWYDRNSRLIRMDFMTEPLTPNDDDINEATQVITLIYDFSVGYRFEITRSTRECSVEPIPHDDGFVSKKSDLFTLIADPNEILQISNDFKYKGKYFARDIMSDVWTGELKGKDENSTIYKEVYFSTEGWHSIAEEDDAYHVPVMQTEVYTEPDGQNQIVLETNYYRFEQVQPHLTSFSVSECLETITHKYFSFRLIDENLQEEILQHRRQFLDSTHKAIVKYGKLVSLIRVQEITIDQHDNKDLVVEFAILERPEADKGYHFDGSSLDEAVQKIKKAVDNSSFSIRLEFRNDDPLSITVVKDSFIPLDREIDESLQQKLFKREALLEAEDTKQQYSTDSLKDDVAEQEEILKKLKKTMNLASLRKAPEYIMGNGIYYSSNPKSDENPIRYKPGRRNELPFGNLFKIKY